MHNRLGPKKHRFHYSVFMFCLDLDALDEDLREISLVKRNRFSLFSFYDKDHVVNEQGTQNAGNGVRSELDFFLRKNGMEKP
ncbi:MAG TPA: DUF1365 family protein, partial [Bacteroidia bacterium]|nr:DUF1365 family protein [Bacteroidia bacterium]